jgi:hypothetical protein
MAGTWVWGAGWRDLNNAVAHLVLAARATTGDGAPDYVRERICDVVTNMTDDDMQDLADGLVAEAERAEAERAEAERMSRRHDRVA